MNTAPQTSGTSDEHGDPIMPQFPNDMRKSDLMATVRQLGREAAMGKDSKMKLALHMARAARDGVIGEDDVEEFYDAYLTSESKKAIHEHSAAGKTANRSKVRVIVKAASVPALDFPATLETVVEVRESFRQSETKMHAAFDCAVNAARKQLEQPDRDLDRDQVEAICTKPEPEEKDLVAKLCAEYKKLYSLTEKANETQNASAPHIEASMHAIGDAIVEAGGELPPVTKKQKELVAFAARAHKLGVQLSS
jgi:hypothetical protein